jgi:purine-binding chemotaxis protein CheW
MRPGTQRAAGIDWAEIMGRLERSIAASDPDAADERARARLLRERTVSLARPLPALVEANAGDQLELLDFEVAGARYAVESRYVAQALRLPPLTALPGLPAHVVGIVPFRGRVLAVLDPRSLLALPLARLAEPEALVVLHDGAMEFGLLVDAIGQVRRHPRASLQPPMPATGAARRAHMLGIAPGRTAVLDAGALLNDSTLAVQAGQ